MPKEETIYTTSITLKQLLAPYSNDAAQMKTAFNAYMLKNHKATEGDDTYKDMVNIFCKRCGLKGYMTFMGVN